jgi:hypothetical protein
MIATIGLTLPAFTQSTVAQDTSRPIAPNIEAHPVKSIKALKTLQDRPAVILLLGYDQPGDGGGGLFQWISGDPSSSDDGLLVRPLSGPPGNYKRIFSGAISVKWFGAKGDGKSDDTLPLQTAINQCAGPLDSANVLYLPAGSYRVSATLLIPRQYFQMFGDGMYQSRILYSGTSGAALSAAPMPILQPVLRDFAIIGGVTSGKGIDFGEVRNTVMMGELRNLYIESGDDAVYIPRMFSMVFDNVAAGSSTGHSFRGGCGPSVSWRNCYALEAGPRKAGYRLNGCITLYSCNGVNKADYWGVFGTDVLAGDDFSRDFPANDYPDVTMIGCNVEGYASRSDFSEGCGLLLHNGIRQFNMIGGKFERDESTRYHSVIRQRKAPLSNNMPVRLAPAWFSPGPGKALASPLCSDVHNAFFSDENGVLASFGVTTWLEQGIAYPLMRTTGQHDVYGETATYFPAVVSDRLTINTMRFNELKVGSGTSAIDVTGKTMVLTQNDQPTFIHTLYLKPNTPGRENASRNGLLIVQVEDNFTTFKHKNDAPDGLLLKSGVDYQAKKGDVLVFVRSRFFDGMRPGWVQI